MTDVQELQFALLVLGAAEDYAEEYSDEQDVSAATVAILMKAFELATQDLSAERRNQLLKGEWE